MGLCSFKPAKKKIGPMKAAIRCLEAGGMIALAPYGSSHVGGLGQRRSALFGQLGLRFSRSSALVSMASFVSHGPFVNNDADKYPH